MSKYIEVTSKGEIIKKTNPDYFPSHLIEYVYSPTYDSKRLLQDYVIRNLYKSPGNTTAAEKEKLETALILFSNVEMIKSYVARNQPINKRQEKEFEFIYNSAIETTKELGFPLENMVNDIVLELAHHMQWGSGVNEHVKKTILNNIIPNSNKMNVRKISFRNPLLMAALYKDIELIEHIVKDTIFTDDINVLTHLKLKENKLLNMENDRADSYLLDNITSAIRFDKGISDETIEYLLSREVFLYSLFFEWPNSLNEKRKNETLISNLKKMVKNNENIGLTESQEEAILFCAVKNENLPLFKSWDFAIGTGEAGLELLRNASVENVYNRETEKFELIENNASEILFKNANKIKKICEKRKINLVEEWVNNVNINSDDIKMDNYIEYSKKILNLYSKIKEISPEKDDISLRKILASKIEQVLKVDGNDDSILKEKKFLDITIYLSNVLNKFKDGEDISIELDKKAKVRL